MSKQTLIKHESPGGPYWYHPDHPLCQDGHMLHEPMEECKGCGGSGTHIEGEQGAQYKAACEHCDGIGFVEANPTQPSVTELTAIHPNLHEYIKSLEDRLARITDHYNILRVDLVEREAHDLYGGFQAAANYKDLDTCRMIANARLRGKCSGCNGTGCVGKPASQTHDAESEECPWCEGNGFVEIPELPSGTESETHNAEVRHGAKDARHD